MENFRRKQSSSFRLIVSGHRMSWRRFLQILHCMNRLWLLINRTTYQHRLHLSIQPTISDCMRPFQIIWLRFGGGWENNGESHTSSVCEIKSDKQTCKMWKKCRVMKIENQIQFIFIVHQFTILNRHLISARKLTCTYSSTFNKQLFILLTSEIISSCLLAGPHDRKADGILNTDQSARDKKVQNIFLIKSSFVHQSDFISRVVASRYIHLQSHYFCPRDYCLSRFSRTVARRRSKTMRGLFYFFVSDAQCSRVGRSSTQIHWLWCFLVDPSR